MKKTAAILLLFLCNLLHTQVLLPYSIGNRITPSDSEKIVESTTPFGDERDYFMYSGFLPGDIVCDFILHDTSGKATRLSDVLAQGKPVLLISASYTCPFARRSTAAFLDTLVKTYRSMVNILLIYTLEAHPVPPETCPYTDTKLNLASNKQNREDSIFYHQPRTYYDRKKTAEEFIADQHIPVPVLLDTPDNAYWKNFGPAPNNAYLLAPNGEVYRKWAWLEGFEGAAAYALIANESLMHPDPEKNPTIDNADPGKIKFSCDLDAKYSVSVYNNSGKKVFMEGKLTSPEYDLGKAALPPGEYSVVVKISNGNSCCVRWHLN